MDQYQIETKLNNIDLRQDHSNLDLVILKNVDNRYDQNVGDDSKTYKPYVYSGVSQPFLGINEFPIHNAKTIIGG